MALPVSSCSGLQAVLFTMLLPRRAQGSPEGRAHSLLPQADQGRESVLYTATTPRPFPSFVLQHGWCRICWLQLGHMTYTTPLVFQDKRGRGLLSRGGVSESAPLKEQRREFRDFIESGQSDHKWWLPQYNQSHVRDSCHAFVHFESSCQQ